MLHHISFGVTDLGRAAAFYDAVLSTLGYVRVWQGETGIGYGVRDGEDRFAIKQEAGARAPGPRFHLAFTAPNRDAVAAFHRVALAHGARDNGAPGLRPQYGRDYYASFVIDPDGYPIEAVINKASA